MSQRYNAVLVKGGPGKMRAVWNTNDAPAPSSESGSSKPPTVTGASSSRPTSKQSFIPREPKFQNRKGWRYDEKNWEYEGDKNYGGSSSSTNVHAKYDSEPREVVEEIVENRVAALYDDYKVRKLRQQALQAEKERLEEEYFAEHRRFLELESERRELNPKQYQEYWDSRVAERQNHLAARVYLKKKLESKREEEELKECTFKPTLIAKDGFIKKRKATQARYKRKLLALAQVQRAQLNTLEDLHCCEETVENKLKAECEKKLDEVLKKNVYLVDRFLETPKGSELVKNRTEAYMQANPGLERDRAETEAITDLLAKNKENIRDRVMDDFRSRRILQRKDLAVRKLQVVVELQRLESDYKEMALDVQQHSCVMQAIKGIEADNRAYWQRKEGGHEVSKDEEPLIFKTDLVAQLKQEPWFIIAQHVAEGGGQQP